MQTQLVLLRGTQQFSSWPEARHKAHTNTHSKPAHSLCVKNTQRHKYPAEKTFCYKSLCSVI